LLGQVAAQEIEIADRDSNAVSHTQIQDIPPNRLPTGVELSLLQANLDAVGSHRVCKHLGTGNGEKLCWGVGETKGSKEGETRAATPTLVRARFRERRHLQEPSVGKIMASHPLLA